MLRCYVERWTAFHRASRGLRSPLWCASFASPTYSLRPHHQGANIKKIDELSGADLKVNKPENTITISGDAAQVARAKELIELYMAGGPPPDCREEVELGSGESEAHTLLNE